MRYLIAILLLFLMGWAVAKKPSKNKQGDEDTPQATQSQTVTLSFRTSPGRKARVYHGRKRLGVTPFRAKFKRNSGPLDLVFRAGGYLPVNVRAYTYKDKTIMVRLTPNSKKQRLFGYRKELPPDGGIDATPSPADAARSPAATDAGLPKTPTPAIVPKPPVIEAPK